MSDIANIDCIIIGAGFCGSVIARKLAEQNKRTLVFERRNHIAGNMYDETDSSGILVQRYGPHIFHTKSKEVYEFITKYDTWIDYYHQPAVEMDGHITPSPSNFKTIDLLYKKEEAAALKSQLETRYSGQKTVSILELLDCENPVIRQYAERLYELNYRPYTAKQWGISPEEVDPGVLKRVPIRLDYTNGYFDDEFQCMPEKGYTHFFENLLAHENIQVRLNTNALDIIKVDTEKRQMLFEGKPLSIPVVYTSAIDDLLACRHGQLPYRSLRFDYQTKNVDSFQEASVLAYPKAEGYTRITEFKKLPPQNIPGVTTVAYEYPLDADTDNEPYYPVLNDNSAALYDRYLRDVQGIANLFLCGRLADYRYYNMDTAILRAFDVFRRMRSCNYSMKTMDIPIISIIVPIYKTEKYISRCLESLINQTFRNIEIICINDGSPDKAMNICEDYAKKDRRIITLSQTNQGLSAARNIGLLYARGKYIQFCDSDDYYALTMCEKMLNVISLTDVDVVVASVNVIKGSSDFLRANGFKVPFKGMLTITDATFKQINVFAWNKIFKKELIDRFDIVFPCGRHYEDAGFLFKYLTIAKTIYCIDEQLYNYVYQRHGSIMEQTRNSKPDYAIDHIYVIQDVAVFLNTHGLQKRYEQAFIWMVLTYTGLACMYGGEKVYKTAFEIGSQLLRNIDFNPLMSKNYSRDDIFRLYSLKKGDSEMYFWLEKHNRKFDGQSKKSVYITALCSCVFFPWYIYKIFCVVYNNQLPQRNIDVLFKAYLFFPYYVLKIYLAIVIR